MTMPARPVAGLMAPWAFPPPWVHQWQRADLPGDLTAGFVVAVMLVPQSLAYAMLAGLPPQAGLLASLLPLLAYALFGSSRAMSVGPAAITSLMVAQALAPLAVQGSVSHAAMAMCLALGSGVLMLFMGLWRMGFLSQLLSRPVVQGFTVASAMLILAGQMAPVLGWGSLGYTLPEMARTVLGHVRAQSAVHAGDAIVGLGAIALLWAGPWLLAHVARALAWPLQRTKVLTRLWPMLVLALATLGAAGLGARTDWRPALVGAVALQGPVGEGSWARITQFDADQWSALAMPALLIAMVSFVSSVSVAQTFALRRGERIDADRELLGLGLANLGSTVLGGMPVAGGLSRSVVNEAAGARSPLSGVISAGLLAVLLWVAMPWMAWLPKAALAAVIMAGVSSLIEWQSLRAAWRYDRAEAWSFLSTALGVLLVGFEAGILLGMAWAMGAMIWRHSQPHIAEVGRLPGSEHFRNVSRHQIETLPGVLMLRVDESLDFTNIQRVEQTLCERVHAKAGVQHVVLLLSAVNHIDHTAVQALQELDKALSDQGKRLYLAEIKGPVMDRLQAGQVADRFAGRVFMSAQQAWDTLS
jgi:SulP family sulfate permease